MVLLAPVPGMVAKLTRNAKIAQLRGTDARMQKVTESGPFTYALSFFLTAHHLLSPSDERSTHGQVIRLDLFF